MRNFDFQTLVRTAFAGLMNLVTILIIGATLATPMAASHLYTSHRVGDQTSASDFFVEMRRYEPSRMVVIERIGGPVGNRRNSATTPVGDIPPSFVELNKQIAPYQVRPRGISNEPIAFWLAPAVAAFGLTGGFGVFPTPSAVEWLVSAIVAAWAMLSRSRRWRQARQS